MCDLKGTSLTEDPLSVVLKECLEVLVLLRANRKKLQQKSNAASLIVGGSNEYFGSEASQTDFQDTVYIMNDTRDSILSELVRLRDDLSDSSSIYSVDSLTLLNPFLRILKEMDYSVDLVNQVLESIRRFYILQIINSNCINYVQAYRNTVVTLLELGQNPNNGKKIGDDSQIRIITLLQLIISTTCGDCLSDSLVYQSLKKVLFIVCRRKISDKLMTRAEYTLKKMTIRIATKLKFMNLTEISNIYIDDEQIKKYFLYSSNVSSSEFDLNDAINHAPSEESLSMHNKDDFSESTNYGLPVVIRYLILLLSLIGLESKSDYTIRSQILGLKMIKTMVELVGTLFLKHPKLLNMISDPIFKCVTFILENNDNKLELFENALSLYVTIVLSLGWFLPRQINLTMKSLFIRLDKSSSIPLKTIIIQQLSMLWTRKPKYFIHIFIKYDCNFEYEDISISFLTALTRLIDLKTDLNLVTFALDGLSKFISSVHRHINDIDELQFDNAPQSKILAERAKKTDFIECVNLFNTKATLGIDMLIERGFIENSTNASIAKFLFENNTRINKKQLGLLLCNPNKIDLLTCFIANFDFKGLRVDEALRILLTKFRLPGESQQIERIIEVFSKLYVEKQQYVEPLYLDDLEHVQPDPDSVFILSYSIIMLNTDLHNPQVKQHMSFEDYSQNLKGCYNSIMDYPVAFLQKIYSSIENKEIVMPEEHHGNEKWFDDIWNNLISSNTVVTEIPKIHLDDINRFNSLELAQFEMKLFEVVGPSIVRKLLHLLNNSKDESTIIELINYIEKTYTIAKFFKLKNTVNIILVNLAESTTISKIQTTSSNANKNGEYDNDSDFDDTNDSPIVDIVDKSSDVIIPVSISSVALGQSFKGQMSLILYFKIFKQNKFINFIEDTNINQLFGIILTMFENRMIINQMKNDTFYPNEHLSKKYSISELSLPQSVNSYDYKGNNSNRSLLSSFASYLKGDNEPSDEDIRYAISSNECIKMINFTQDIWSNKTLFTSKDILRFLEDYIPSKKNTHNYKYFEDEILFIIELSMSLMIDNNWTTEVGPQIYAKVLELAEREGLTKKYYRRLMVYKLLLIDLLNKSDDEVLIEKVLEENIIKDNEVFNKSFFETQDGQFTLKLITAHTAIFDKKQIWDLYSNLNKTGIYSKLLHLPDNLKLNTDNLQWFLELVNEVQGMDYIVFQLLDGERKTETELTELQIVSLIQIIMNDIVDNTEETDDLIKRLKQSLTGEGCLLKKLSKEKAGELIIKSADGIEQANVKKLVDEAISFYN